MGCCLPGSAHTSYFPGFCDTALIQLSYGFDDGRIVETDRCEGGVSVYDRGGSARCRVRVLAAVSNRAACLDPVRGRVCASSGRRSVVRRARSLSGARGFAVRTISGEIVGELFDVCRPPRPAGWGSSSSRGCLGDAGVCRQSWCSAPARVGAFAGERGTGTFHVLMRDGAGRGTNALVIELSS